MKPDLTLVHMSKQNLTKYFWSSFYIRLYIYECLEDLDPEEDLTTFPHGKGVLVEPKLFLFPRVKFLFLCIHTDSENPDGLTKPLT